MKRTKKMVEKGKPAVKESLGFTYAKSSISGKPARFRLSWSDRIKELELEQGSEYIRDNETISAVM